MKITAVLIQSLVFSAALALTGCGGGGGDTSAPGAVAQLPPTPVAITAEGLYLGTTSTGRTVTGIILDNGTYWVIYSVANNSAVIAGAVQGTGTSLNGNFTSSNAKDFNVEGQRIDDATVSASYVAKQSLNGLVTYPATSLNVTFVSTYSAAYDQAPSLVTIAGTYTGTAAVVGGTEPASLVISASGGLTGVGASGCQFSGTVSLHPKGNVYDVAVTFAGGVCSNGTSTVTGIGYFDSATKRLYSTALNSSRTNGFIFVGTKP